MEVRSERLLYNELDRASLVLTDNYHPSIIMSFLRTSALRLSRPMAARGYADKSMGEKAGDMLKKAGQAFKVCCGSLH